MSRASRSCGARDPRCSARSPAAASAPATPSVAPAPKDPERPGDRDAALLRLRRHGHRRAARPVPRAEPRPQPRDGELQLRQGGRGEARRRLRGRRGRGLRRRDAAAARSAACSGRSIPKGVTDFDQLALSDSDEIRNDAGKVLFVPASAGPARADRQHRRGRPEPDRLLRRPLRSAVRGPGGDRVDAADGDRGRARWRSGMDDPMDLSPDEIDQVKEYLLDHRDQFRDFAESDASMVNDFKSGEVGDRRRRPRDRPRR